jgi:xylulose-5-phosphate/fructose-6-phosphate phosphoketolase
MIVLRSPNGWTGPKEVDGHRVEGYWRSHQVPFAVARNDDGHRPILEEWLRSYRPDELFTANGSPVARWPTGTRQVRDGSAPTHTPIAVPYCGTCPFRTSATTPST